VPLADNASEREIIRRHHVANTRQEMKEAMQRVKSLLSADRERAPRSDVVANEWAHFRALQRRSATYASVLKDEQDEIEDMGKLLKKQLDKLIGALQLGDCTPTACSRSLWTTDGDRCDDRVRIVGHGLKLVGTPKCETRAARRALYPRTGV
jgi:hypothetical protein